MYRKIKRLTFSTSYGIIDWNPPESQASPDTHKKVSVMDMTPFPYRHQLLSVRGNSYLHSQREFTWDTCPPTQTQSRRDKIYTHIFCSGGRSSISSDTAHQFHYGKYNSVVGN